MKANIQAMLNGVADKLSTSFNQKVDVTEFIENAVAKSAEIKTNAGVGETMSTGNTGFGAEIARTVTYSDNVYDFAVQDQTGLLAKLPGSHGDGLAGTVNAPIIGELGDFDSSTETSGAYTMFSELNKGKSIATDKTAIVIKGFSKQVSVTKQELFRTYASGGSAGLYNYILSRITLSMRKTIENYIINADTTTDKTPVGSANVNFFDTANNQTMPAAALYLGGNKGIRKVGIDAGIVGGAVALDRNTVLRKSMGQLAQYLSNPKDLLWITGGVAANEIGGLPEYSTRQVFGMSTNENGGFISGPEGIEAYVSDRFPSYVGVSGKVEVSSTAANNYCSTALIHRYAPQYCFGMPVQMATFETAQNIMIDVYFEFGCEVVSARAGLNQTVSVAVFNK